MFREYLHTITLIARPSMVGGATIVACVILGWRVGHARDSGLVRLVIWWLRHVVQPLVGSRSWLRRIAIIAANNTLVCATVVALGALGSLAWLAVGGIGLGLGVAMRLTLGETTPGETPDVTGPRRPLIEAVGLTLNLLEIPAIGLAAGLSLAQAALPVDGLGLSRALGTFAACVIPLLLVSAAGEALWMGQHKQLADVWPRLPKR